MKFSPEELICHLNLSTTTTTTTTTGRAANSTADFCTGETLARAFAKSSSHQGWRLFHHVEGNPFSNIDDQRVRDCKNPPWANSLSIDADGVKLDFLRHAYPLQAPVEHIDGITLVSLPDLAAMKLNAIANRGSKKDFYDFAELLRHFTVNQMIEFFIGKYPNTDPFTVIRSLAWFEDAEQEPIHFL